MIQLTVRAAGYLCLVLALLYQFQNVTALMNFRKIRLQTLENEIENGAGPADLRSIRMFMSRSLEKLGPRLAAVEVEEKFSALWGRK